MDWNSPSKYRPLTISDEARERIEFRNFGKGFAVVSMKEEAIREELKRVGYVVPTDELTEVLIRQLATVQTSGQFERTYRLIFGSQIRFLDYLNSEGLQSFEIAQHFYDVASLDQPAAFADFPVTSWLGFLLNQMLIRRDDVDGVTHYSLTVLGKDFLLWLVTESLRRENPTRYRSKHRQQSQTKAISS